MRILLITSLLLTLASCSFREEPKAGREVQVNVSSGFIVTGSLIQPVR